MSFYDEYFGKFFEDVDDADLEKRVYDIIEGNNEEINDLEKKLNNDVKELEEKLNQKDSADKQISENKKSLEKELEEKPKFIADFTADEEGPDKEEVAQAYKEFLEQDKEKDTDKKNKLESLKRLQNSLSQPVTPKKLKDESGQDEQVHHPDHYNQSFLETIEKFLLFFGDNDDVIIGGLMFNVLKYTDRAGFKGGSEDSKKQDEEKALFYLDLLLTLFPDNEFGTFTSHFRTYHDIKESKYKKNKN